MRSNYYPTGRVSAFSRIDCVQDQADSLYYNIYYGLTSLVMTCNVMAWGLKYEIAVIAENLQKTYLHAYS